MSKFTRGRALTSIATIPAAELAAPADDQLAAAIEAYRAGLAAFAAIPESELTPENEEEFIERTYGSAREFLWSHTPPAASLAGVREAIRLALDEDAFICRMSENVLRSALAYLDAQAGGSSNG